MLSLILLLRESAGKLGSILSFRKNSLHKNQWHGVSRENAFRRPMLAIGLGLALSGCAHDPHPCWDMLLTGPGTLVIDGEGNCGRPVEDEITEDPAELVAADRVIA